MGWNTRTRVQGFGSGKHLGLCHWSRYRELRKPSLGMIRASKASSVHRFARLQRTSLVPHIIRRRRLYIACQAVTYLFVTSSVIHIHDQNHRGAAAWAVTARIQASNFLSWEYTTCATNCPTCRRTSLNQFSMVPLVPTSIQSRASKIRNRVRYCFLPLPATQFLESQHLATYN